MPAFGSLPGEIQDAGIPVPKQTENLPEQVADDLYQIRHRYVDGATNYRQELRLAANGGLKIDLTGWPVTSIILTVVSGVIYGYLTDQSTQFGLAALPPDFCASAGVIPTTVQIVVPYREDYILSFQEGAGSAAVGVGRVLKL